jgi:hypothetical protein
MLTLFGVISIHSSKKDARNIEHDFTPGHKNVHFLREKKKMFTKMFTLLLDVGFIREVEKPSGPLLGLIVMSH